MTDYESALSELGTRLTETTSPLGASLGEILADAIQELIEAEVTARIGAEPHERTLTRTTQRNGHRPKLVSTPAGDLEVKIPKLRTGSFFPELLEPRRRIDKALWAVIMTAYVTGTSTRKVDDLVKALGCDSGVSRRRCRGSANTSTPTWPCSAPEIWAISRSCTSGSTPPMCMSATAARSSPKRS